MFWLSAGPTKASTELLVIVDTMALMAFSVNGPHWRSGWPSYVARIAVRAMKEAAATRAMVISHAHHLRIDAVGGADSSTRGSLGSGVRCPRKSVSSWVVSTLLYDGETCGMLLALIIPFICCDYA